MNVTVRIPPPLRSETAAQSVVPASGDTVRDVLSDLVARFPSLAARVLTDEGIGGYVNVYVDGEDVRTLDGLETTVEEGATVILLPAVAGGRD